MAAPQTRSTQSSTAASRRGHCAVAGLTACAVLLLAATGCASNNKLRVLSTKADFDREVTKARGPVFLEFYRGGCAACMFLDGTMDQLYDEYNDRVSMVRFQLMGFLWEVPCQEIYQRYRIGSYPTVILFVDGRERKRWVVDYNADHYRKVLDTVAPKPDAKPEARAATQ